MEKLRKTSQENRGKTDLEPLALDSGKKGHVDIKNVSNNRLFLINPVPLASPDNLVFIFLNAWCCCAP